MSSSLNLVDNEGMFKVQYFLISDGDPDRFSLASRIRIPINDADPGNKKISQNHRIMGNSHKNRQISPSYHIFEHEITLLFYANKSFANTKHSHFYGAL